MVKGDWALDVIRSDGSRPVSERGPSHLINYLFVSFADRWDPTVNKPVPSLQAGPASCWHATCARQQEYGAMSSQLMFTDDWCTVLHGAKFWNQSSVFYTCKHQIERHWQVPSTSINGIDGGSEVQNRRWGGITWRPTWGTESTVAVRVWIGNGEWAMIITIHVQNNIN